MTHCHPVSDAALRAALLQIAVKQQVLAAAGLTHRPAPPQPTTCCGRGCSGCVWEGWYAAVQYWHQQADQLLSTMAHLP